ncbi:MAG: DUF885 domain-containing protein [Saccharofermentans sp.]|nr:DUF885 domain-containing protein [Saccharofermentans sp.]
MNRKIRTTLAMILVLAMTFNVASCSTIEKFFNLDHSSRRERHRDDDDEDETEPEETEETETEETSETRPNSVTPSASGDPSNNGLTYPDHVPTYDEIHPSHPAGTVSGQEASDLLDEIEMQILQDELGASYVDADILFDDYSAFGIEFDSDEIGWGEVMSDHDEDVEEVNEVLDQLYSIDRDSLDTDDRIFYDKLLNDIELSAYALQYTAFDYYESVLKSLTGPQSEVLFILDVLDFETVEDAENYILVLRDIDRYYDDMCAFEEERASYGYVNSDDVYEDVAESFDNLVAQSEDCFLYESFQTRLDNIPNLSDSDRQSLIEEHDQVMHDIVFPEFEECAQRIRALKCGAPDVGVCSYPGGDAYFAYIFATQTNSGRSIDEAIEELENYSEYVADAVFSVAATGNTDWLDEYMNHDYSEGDTQENLDFLYDTVQDDFPAIPDHDYRLMTVPEVFADSFSPAAFLGYHLDRYDHNIVITNEASIGDTFGITCAHEGYPGHMYQSVYHRTVCSHPYMYLADSIGYAEGWATYVENYSFKYFSTSDASDIIRAENQFNTILFARFDLGVNYEGWTAQDCADWYADLMGMSASADMFMDAYNLLLSDPGYGIKYGLGYLFTGLTMTELSERYPDASDLEIHTAYLNAQPGTFEQILENASEELASGSVNYPVANWGDSVSSASSGGSSSSGSGSSQNEPDETEPDETEPSESTSARGSLWGL